MPSPTIAAIATGPAAGGIGIVRVSGARCLDVVRRLCPAAPAVLPPREAVLTQFVGADQNVVDEGLVLFFPGPNSYTGEDLVEFQVHGAPRLLQLLLTSTLNVDGVRLAEPGEFTRRAFMSGRIDLARAEAVADLIAATSNSAVQAAALQLVGALSQRIEEIRAPLVGLHADLEAALDFPEEAEDTELDVLPRLEAASRAVAELLRSGSSGVLIRRGARVVLYGPVNAGKSTLFNRLVGAERALVDELPGTTRDALEARLEWEGLQVTLIDTAGLRPSPERLEARGIERTRLALKGADLAVLMLPPRAEAGELAAWRADSADGARLEVVGKSDLAAQGGAFGVSGKTGAGVDALRSRILEALGYRRAEAVALSSARHLEALARAVDALERATAALQVSTLEVVAGEVGAAVLALSEITGEDARSELLDAIFQRFCIGK